MFAEIKRKLFHLLGMIYIVALIYMPRPLYLGVLAAAVALAFLFEMCRLKNARFKQWFLNLFGGLLREEEHTRFSGFFWMLSGVAVTVLLLKPVPLATTAVLYLLLGDGVASLVGMRFGGPRWPGSKKTLSGSFACFIVCLFVGLVFLRPIYAWHGVLIGAVVATLVERGFIKIDDNFMIPVAAAVTFLVSYGLQPIR